MKVAVLHGAHSNIHALKAVLSHAESNGVDKLVMLGDFIGLGAKPNEVAKEVLDNFDIVLGGLYEKALVDNNYFLRLPDAYKDVVFHARGCVGEEIKNKIKTLPNKQSLEGLAFVYFGLDSSLSTPSKNNVMSIIADNMESDVVFISSETMPHLWIYHNNDISLSRVRVVSQEGNVGLMNYPLDKGVKYVFYGGSVGRPVDGDFRASYCVYDIEENAVHYYKIPYDNHKAVIEMQMAGFSQAVWKNVLYGR